MYNQKKSGTHYYTTVWKVSKYGVYSGPYFPVFGLNTEIYRVNLLIQSEYRKIRTRKNSAFGHFSHSASFDLVHFVKLEIVLRLNVKLMEKHSQNNILHVILLTLKKLCRLKAPPKRKLYRNYWNYKAFDEDDFNKNLKLKLNSSKELGYSLFESTLISVLNAHAPLKVKTLWANNHQFMTKPLRKAIMKV